MEIKYILCVDVGTQSLRASIVDNQGNFKCLVRRKYDQPYFSPKLGYTEQHPDFYYKEVCAATNEIKKNNGELLGKCKSLVITMFRDSAALLDKNYNEVRPTILWLDQRNAKCTKKLPALYRFIYRLVGLTETVNYNRKRTPANWIQENEPENWKKIAHYVPLTAYMTYRITGELKDSAANCTGHFPIDFKTGKWYSTKALKFPIFGIDKDKLCPIVQAGEVLGKVTKRCSLDSGIPEGTTMYACGTDKSCETLGNGCLECNTGTLSLGTACTIDVPFYKYGEPESFLPGYLACYPKAFNLEVQIYRGFWMLSWFVKNFATSEIQEAKDKNVCVEEIFDEKIANIEAGSNGLILQPYWGPGLKRPLARGAIVGFSDFHSKYHLYRAMIEGIFFALYEGFVSIKKTTKKDLDFLVISGGGATNDVICQMAADIFNVKVKRSQTVETSLLGTAVAGFTFEGTYKSIDEASKAMTRYSKEFVPIKENVNKYTYLYKTAYCKLYPELNKTYEKLKEYSSNEIL